MNPNSILLILIILLSSSLATAQCCDGQDEICIFWSLAPGGCLNCAFSAGEPVEAFVVLINASQSSGTGDDGFRIACLNDPGCPPPVTVEGASWGAVKWLFR